MVTLPLPQGLGAQSARASSQAFENSFRPATKRPACTQSERETAPLPFGRGETSALNPAHTSKGFTTTVKVRVALNLGVPLSVTETMMRFVLGACAKVG